MEPVIDRPGSTDLQGFVGGPRAAPPVNELIPTEIQPTFTLTFSAGTSMREVHVAVIKTVLHYARSNRRRAAHLLQISPPTIRRRLGKKEAATTAIRA